MGYSRNDFSLSTINAGVAMKKWLLSGMLLLLLLGGGSFSLMAETSTTATGNSTGNLLSKPSGFNSLQNLLGAVPEPVITATSFPIENESREKLYQLIIMVELPEESYLYAEDPAAFTISQIVPEGEVLSIVYPSGVYSSSAERDLYQGRTIFVATIRIPTGGLDPEEILITYQICNTQGVCYIPKETLVPLRLSSAPLTPPEEGEAVVSFAESESLDTSSLTGVSALDKAGSLEAMNSPSGSGQSFWLMLLFALLGGILMNFMPCTLPVLSLRVIGISQAVGKSARILRRENYLFLLGMGAVVVALGGITLAIQSAGVAVGWGFQFQNPLFTMGMITLLFLFTLSLFGLFEVPGIGVSKQNPSWGSFTMGALAALMATPCTAPLLGPAIGYGLSRSTAEGLLFFFAIGVGFVLPLLLITAIPGFWKIIPKPGKWTHFLRYGMGAVLVGFIIYLGSSLTRLIAPDSLRTFGFFLTGLLISIVIIRLLIGWTIRGSKASWRRERRLHAIGVLLFVALLISGWITTIIPASQKETTTTAAIPTNWEYFSEDLAWVGSAGIDSAGIGSTEPLEGGIFIAFSASWCSTCKINEKTTLFTQETQQLFYQKKITPFYGDFSKFDPTIAQWIEYFGRSGVPLYLYKPAKSNEFRVLPQILSYDILERAFQ